MKYMEVSGGSIIRMEPHPRGTSYGPSGHTTELEETAQARRAQNERSALAQALQVTQEHHPQVWHCSEHAGWLPTRPCLVSTSVQGMHMAERHRCVRRLVHAFGSTRRQRQLKERDLAQVGFTTFSWQYLPAGRGV